MCRNYPAPAVAVLLLSATLFAEAQVNFEIKRDTNVPSGGDLSLVQADFNSDGAPDLLFGNNQNILLRTGDGSGNFAAPKTVAVATGLIQTITVADFNSDGHPDILVTHQYPSQTVEVFLNNGDGTFWRSHRHYLCL